MILGVKGFGEVIESLSQNEGTKFDGNATPQCGLNEEKNISERCGRHRSLSDPRSISVGKISKQFISTQRGVFY